jgi:pre-mRNA-splicing factor SYF1
MAALERQARAPVGFVAASSGPEGGNRPQAADNVQASNPDAIDLDDEMDADEGEDEK